MMVIATFFDIESIFNPLLNTVLTDMSDHIHILLLIIFMAFPIFKNEHYAFRIAPESVKLPGTIDVWVFVGMLLLMTWSMGMWLMILYTVMIGSLYVVMKRWPIY